MDNIMPTTLESLFKSSNNPRDNFLSRLFGMFSEEIVRCWCRDSRTPYQDIGRPTIKSENGKRLTLDFTFESRNDHKVYVSEMKCWMAYENYRYLTLESPTQLTYSSLNNDAFRLFLNVAKNPSQYGVTVNSKPQLVDGAILVWSRCTEQGKNSTAMAYGFHDVISLEAIITDLTTWKNPEFSELLNKYEDWTHALFSGLHGIGQP
jgi:hypothetical protein